MLGLLLTRCEVGNVYCLVRGENPQERVLEALKERWLSVPDTTRLVTLTSDLSRRDLGLSASVFERLQSETTSIIHEYVPSPRCAPRTCLKMRICTTQWGPLSIMLSGLVMERVSSPRKSLSLV